MDNMLTENEVAASKTVDARVLTDRQTHRQTDTHTHTHTHTHTDRHDRFNDSCPSVDGQL